MSVVTVPLENKVWVIRIWGAEGLTARNRVLTATRAEATRIFEADAARYGPATRITLHPIGEAVRDSRNAFNTKVTP